MRNLPVKIGAFIAAGMLLGAAPATATAPAKPGKARPVVAAAPPATHFGLENYWTFEDLRRSTRWIRFADVDGDGRSDAVLMAVGCCDDEPSGRVFVLRSTGASFGPSVLWASDENHDSPTDFADVNGDGTADALYIAPYEVLVRLSNGHGFGPKRQWASLPPYPASYLTDRSLIDMDGDGFADFVSMSDNEDMLVWRSDGTRFLPPETWAPELYHGPYVQAMHLCDVDADGLVDFVSWADAGLTVRRSDGTKFGPVVTWSTTPFAYTQDTFCGDVDGDGRADAVAVNDTGITVRRSDGTRFLPTEDWTSGPFVSWRSNFLADLNADGRSDAIIAPSSPYSGFKVRLAE